MTDFSAPQKLYFVLMPQNRHQQVTSTVTRLLVHQARRLAISTTANQAAVYMQSRTIRPTVLYYLFWGKQSWNPGFLSVRGWPQACFIILKVGTLCVGGWSTD